MDEILSEDVLNNDSFLSCAVPTARNFSLLNQLRSPYEKGITRNKLTELRAKLTEIDKCKEEIASLLLKVATIKINPTLGTHIMASLEPRPSSPRFYLDGCEIKSGRGRPGFEAILYYYGSVTTRKGSSVSPHS